MSRKNGIVRNLLLVACMLFVISGCGVEQSNSESETIEGIDIVEETDTQNNEEILTEADLLRLDAENDSIFYLMSQYKLEDSEQDEVNVITFEELIEDFRDIEEDNLFAKAIVEASQSVNYSEMSMDEKIMFDTYLGLLFQDDVIQDNLPIGDVIEAWVGDGKATDKSGNEYQTQYYLFKFSHYNSVETTNFSSYCFLLYYDMGWGTYTALKVPKQSLDNQYGDYRDCLYEIDGQMALVTTFYGSVYVEPIEVSKLNAVIMTNRDFIDFMVDYRDNVYAPIRIAQLEAEETRKEAYRAEKEYWENKIPEIGMIASEVKKTSWGIPDKINKDTYSWGTTEQWVYDGKGYVYFRDGVVTSVSER